METRLHKVIAYIFQPCEENHTKLTMMIFIDFFDTSSCSLCGMRGHVTSNRGNVSLQYSLLVIIIEM